MILISTENTLQNEIKTLHQLFDAGLTHFHIRKPGYTLKETSDYLKKIDSAFHPYCVVYHEELLESFDLRGVHQKSTARNAILLKESQSLSTSTHSMTEFNSLADGYQYAFLSPLFPSISKKGYTPEIADISLETRTNFKTRLIGLGGITVTHIPEILKKVDDIALLGHIWMHNNPVNQWKECQQLVQSYSA